MARISHLGENGIPDVILVYAGTNDAGRSKTLGTVDTTSNPKGISEAALAALPVDTFANAYRTMLLRLMYYYPNAKIVVVGLTYSSNYISYTNVQKYNEVIQQCCELLGVDFIDLRKCGMNPINIASYLPDGIHPNADGMALMFERIYNHIGSTYFVSMDDDVVYYNVTYKYVDSSGNIIKNSVVETVASGSVIEKSIGDAPKIDGYEITSVSPAGSITVTSDIVITYVYSEIANVTYYTVTYKYINASGSEIKAPTTQRVADGGTIQISTSSAPSIDGYEISEVSQSGTITITKDVIITYTYAAIVYYNVTYRYVSTSGSSIKDDVVTAVRRGLVLNVVADSAPEIAGYTVKSVSPSGEVTVNDNITITYTYSVVSTTWYIDDSKWASTANKPANVVNGG